jgi:hypothetical protein
MKTIQRLFVAISLLLLLITTVTAKTITFEPYTKEEEPYLIDGGTHNFARMVADFGAGFTNNHFRFADMAAFWIYRFGFDKPVAATAIMDVGAEFKISIAIREDEYQVVLEEKKHVHDLVNKKVRTVVFGDTFKKPGKTLWMKFEDSLPQEGWGPYLDSFTLEYTEGLSVNPRGRLTTTWGHIKHSIKGK